ncbi:MAG: phosphate acyltransferase PlsX [Verrucomicrobiaceae bacterium]|nr:phosphate acyltransferase PlsX [Verrucomicrobiaceae bacterium]
MKIALDVMGGDNAPECNILGARMALESLPALEKLYMVGTPDIVQMEMEKHGLSSPKLEIVPSQSVIHMEDPSTDAIRKKRDSSITVAMDLVKQHAAQAVVSPGHTGASVAAGTFVLGRLEGVERPGIATPFPNDHGTCLLIDAGANTAPKASHLVQYAIMGTVYSKYIFGKQEPVVGLMSVGEEEGKGNDLTREAYDLLKAAPINFRGNIEGTHLFNTAIDVAVCDGFTGNIILKTAEATAKAMRKWIEQEIKAGLSTKIGGLLAKPAFRRVKQRSSYETYGGSPLLGCRGVVIIGHGSSPPLAVMNAIRVASEAVEHQVNPHIEAALASCTTSA